MNISSEQTQFPSFLSASYIVSNESDLAYCFRGGRNEGWGYQAQSMAFGTVNKESSILISQLNSNSNEVYISRFLDNGVVNQQPRDYMSLSAENIGHQGLAVTIDTNGVTQVIASSSTNGEIIIFPYEAGSTPIPVSVKNKAFGTSEITVGQNKDGTLLVFRQQNTVYVFNADDIISTDSVADAEPVYTINLTPEPLEEDETYPPLQALTITDTELHVVYSGTEIYKSFFYDVYQYQESANWNRAFHSEHMLTGVDDAYASGSTSIVDGWYEAEGLCIKNDIPHLLIISGDPARRLSRIYRLSPSPYPPEKQIYTELANKFNNELADKYTPEQLTEITDAIKNVITKLYRTGVAQKLSHFFIFKVPDISPTPNGSEASLAMINWLDPLNTHLTTVHGGMIFKSNEGFTGTGVSGDYLALSRGEIGELAPIDRGFASFGLVTTDKDGDSGYLVSSSYGNGTSNFRFDPRDINNTCSVSIFGGVYASPAEQDAGKFNGLNIVSRKKNMINFYNKGELISKNKVEYNTPSNAYITLGGGGNGKCNRNLQMFMAGGTLDCHDVKALQEIVDYALHIFDNVTV